MILKMYEIKKQAEDFIVREVTKEGNVLREDENYFFDENSQGKHLICVLTKKNWDTHQAFRRISKWLHISKNAIGFAGTKDKKAVTTQLISLPGVKKEEVEKVKLEDIKLSPLKYSDERISLGSLKGNYFKIKVYTEKKPKQAEKVPNFFGVQRFGKTRPITHLVGEKIVKGKPEEAVMIYLTKTFDGEKEEVKKAREKLNSERDFKKAVEYFPRHLKYERTLITHLAEYEGDYIGALRVLPKTLKMMFVHAYQSYLFNKMLNYIIKNNLKIDELPLVGFDSDLEDWQIKILKKEEVRPEDFRIKFLPELSSPGFMRKTFIKIEKLRIKQEEKNCFLIEFELPKGAYATNVLDFLFDIQRA